MMHLETYIELNEDQFLDRFTLIPNHIDPSARWFASSASGCLFDISGPELEYVKRFDSRKVWTLLEGANGEIHLASGFYYANRVGYLLTNEEVDYRTSIRVRLNTSTVDESQIGSISAENEPNP